MRRSGTLLFSFVFFEVGNSSRAVSRSTQRHYRWKKAFICAKDISETTDPSQNNIDLILENNIGHSKGFTEKISWWPDGRMKLLSLGGTGGKSFSAGREISEEEAWSSNTTKQKSAWKIQRYSGLRSQGVCNQKTREPETAGSKIFNNVSWGCEHSVPCAPAEESKCRRRGNNQYPEFRRCRAEKS